MHLRVNFYGVLTCMCVLLFVGVQSILQKRPKPNRYANAVEFDQLSRSSLLKVLSALEESMLDRAAPNKEKPLFTATFANNKHTRPFIFPIDR